jgi:membrane protein involved in D-alanine export
VGNVVLTLHVVAFGFLIFSGGLNAQRESGAHEFIETADCELIAGWVSDPHAPDKPILLDFYIDDLFISRTPAQPPAGDEVSDRRQTFSLKMPAWVRNGSEHTVELRLAESGRLVHGTPRVIVCEKDPPAPSEP